MKKGSQKDVMLAYLQLHLGEWVPQLRLADVADSVESTRGLRKLREEGYPLDNDGSGNWRLRKEPRQAPRNDDRRSIPSRLRWEVRERDGGRCQLCGVGAGETADDGNPARMEIDHIEPWSKGGKTEASNLRTLCHLCNNVKQDSVPA